jgi:hypothetical protein
MKKAVRYLLCVTVFLLSIYASLGVLERTGAGVKFVLLYGVKGSINGYLLFVAMCICALLFLGAFFLYHRLTTKELKHLLGVSMYLNFINLMAALVMLIVPLVKLRF